MKLETVYEIRTVARGKIIGRDFVSNFPELYDKFRCADVSTQVYFFKIIKDENGGIVSSNKLNCNTSGTSFVVKTIYEKPKRIPKDSGRIEVPLVPKEGLEEIYDIAYLKKSLTVSRARALKAVSKTSKETYRGPKSSSRTTKSPQANSSFRKGKSANKSTRRRRR